MIITVECPSCVTSFPVDTDKVPESGVSARCSICASIFRVERPARREEAGAAIQAESDEASAGSTATAVMDSRAEESWSGDDASEDLQAAGRWDTEVEPGQDVAGADAIEGDVASAVENAWDSEVGAEPPTLDAEPLETESWSDHARGSADPVVESESVEAPESRDGLDVTGELEPIAHSEAPPEAEADWRLSELDPTEEATEAPDFDLADTSIESDRETPGEPVSESGLEIELPEPGIVPEPAPEALDVEAVPAPTEPPPAFQFGKRDPHEKAQRLARVLVSDMIMYNPERHDRALSAGTLKDDFDDEIKKSWEEYVDQVGDEIARSTPYFTDALNDILARGDQVFDDTATG